MKKRILCILSVLALLIGAMASLAGCGGGGGKNKNDLHHGKINAIGEEKISKPQKQKYDTGKQQVTQG